MQTFDQRFARWVIAARWWIIPVTVVLVALAVSGGRLLSFTTDYRIYFGPDDPQLQAFEEMEADYAKNDNLLFVLTPPEGRVFTIETLAAVARLTEGAWQLPYSTRVDSITNFQHSRALGDELRVGDLVPDPTGLDAPALAAIRATVMAEPLLVDRLIASDGRTTGVNVTVHIPAGENSIAVPRIVAAARELLTRVEQAHPQIELRLTGVVPFDNAFSESATLDIQTLVPVSFGVMVLGLVLMLGHWAAVGITLLVISFAILTAMGLGGYLGIPLSPSSVSAPTIILTVAIANAVHVLVGFSQYLGQGLDKDRALEESLRVNLQPLFLTNVTTALGFLSMNFAQVPPLVHLGNLVAMGVVAAFVLSITFLPAVVSLLPAPAPRRSRTDALMVRLGDFVVVHRRKLLWGMGSCALILVLFLPRNELNDVFIHYFDDSIAFRTDSDYTTERLTGIYQIDYSLESGGNGGIHEPAFLEEVAAFADWLRTQPEVIHVSTFTDIMRRLNKNMHGDDPAWYRLPQDRELAAQYLLLYELSLPFGLDLNNQIDMAKSATRLTASLETLSSNRMLALDARARAWLEEHAPHILRAQGSGPSLMFAHIGQRNIVSMLLGTAVALVLISLLLTVALRSVKIGLISLVPNLLPAIMGFGIWGLWVGQIGLALSVVTTMTLGIVVDDTVHFLSKYLHARRLKGLPFQEAVGYAFAHVGRAMVITTLVLVGGFLVLALSSFELNAGMGLLTAIIIALALVCDFLLLPPLLMKLEENSHEKDPVVVATADDAALV